MLIRYVLVFLSVFILFSTPSFAASPKAGATDLNDKTLGTFGKWRAYTSKTNNQPVCYMALTQQFPPSRKMKRGSAYFMITHRPSEGSTDVVSYTAGYDFKPTQDVILVAGKEEFDLFTDKTTAWARDTHTDHAIVTALRNLSSFAITGQPQAKGAAKITDKVDISGIDTAYHAISKACGLEKTVKPNVKKPLKSAPVKPSSTKTTSP